MKNSVLVQRRRMPLVMRRSAIIGTIFLLLVVPLVGCTVAENENTQFTETPSPEIMPSSSTASATPSIETGSDQTTQSSATEVLTPSNTVVPPSPAIETSSDQKPEAGVTAVLTPSNTVVPPSPAIETSSDETNTTVGQMAGTITATVGSIMPTKKTPEQAKDYPGPIPNSEDVAVFEFQKEYVDTNYGGNGKPGWVRAGDMDRDGDVDIVAGGGSALFIYENSGNAGGWKRFGNLDGSSSIGANGAVLFDVDSDNDLDVVSAKFRGDLGWWENPGGPLANNAWQFHKLRSEKFFLHDIIFVDLDKDGKAEEFVTNVNNGYWTASLKLDWYRIGTDPTQPWESHSIEPGRSEGSAHGHSGFDVGDIDKDGHVDVGFSDGWYEAPDNLQTGAWTWHKVSNIYGISNTLVEDMNGDGDLDLVVSAGHHGQGAFWLENDGNPKSGSWTQHNISKVIGDVTKQHVYEANASEHLHHPECLALADLDVDGDMDVVTCDLFFGEDPGEPPWHQEVHNVYVYENLDNALSWEKHNVAPNSYPSHLLQLTDVNRDGRLDIISESAAHSVISYFENSMAGVTPPTTTPTPEVSQTVTATPIPENSDNPIFVPVAASG